MPLPTRAFDRSRLRSLRTDRGWSQSQLARRIGAHVTSISDWERGDNSPSGRYVVSLAREFGVSAESFYGESDDEESRAVAGLALLADALIAALEAFKTSERRA